jgi:hypothetical protein
LRETEAAGVDGLELRTIDDGVAAFVFVVVVVANMMGASFVGIDGVVFDFEEVDGFVNGVLGTLPDGVFGALAGVFFDAVTSDSVVAEIDFDVDEAEEWMTFVVEESGVAAIGVTVGRIEGTFVLDIGVVCSDDVGSGALDNGVVVCRGTIFLVDVPRSATNDDCGVTPDLEVDGLLKCSTSSSCSANSCSTVALFT